MAMPLHDKQNERVVVWPVKAAMAAEDVAF
jgi:hypothetical protein